MKKIYLMMVAVLAIAFTGCSNDDDPTPRSEEDIYGAWLDSDGDYFYFEYPNLCYKLVPSQSTDEVAELFYDSYFYEPGYNFLLYINTDAQPDIYEVTTLTDKEMTWVWADNLRDDKYDGMSGSEILGQMIKEAQDGFKLDYSRTMQFEKISTDDFKKALEAAGYSYLAGEL